MPPLIQNILISTAPDGLLLLPDPSSNPTSPSSSPSSTTAIKIQWRTSTLHSVSPDPAQHPRPPSSSSSPSTLSSPGVLGLLDLVSTTYLLAITSAVPVAQIRGHDIFRVSDVVLIPLSGRAEADTTLSAKLKAHAGDGRKVAEEEAEVESEEEERGIASEGEAGSVGSISDEETGKAAPKKAEGGKGAGGVVRDVIQQQGRYGRFAKQWMSRGGGGREGARRRRQGLSRDEDGGKKKGNEGGKGEKSLAIEGLIPRTVRSARMFFGRSGFYFSYGYDLTRAFKQGRQATGEKEEIDPLFWWNQYLLRPFADGGFGNFALPVIQGFVGQKEFAIARTDGDENDVVVASPSRSKTTGIKQVESIPLGNWTKGSRPEAVNLAVTLISRRSVKRAGLRYLRRGIDEDGNVANSVETEQILSAATWASEEKTFSLVQIRGSMPLFFKQSPYSFKPVPEMFGSEATNRAAFEKHFSKALGRYGAVHAVSLVDKHGTEQAIGDTYEKRVEMINDAGGIKGHSINFEWFDFHGVCKGMKFENISILLNTLSSSISTFSWTEQQNNSFLRQQSGVFRTNCMDCLDRTNVVQSALAGNSLQTQLTTLGLQIDLQSDPSTQWFNVLWADNGDAISRQYAGTAALKGDFTRTRKRNWAGALSDFSLTLNRYYNNIFSDYFLQACIDYYLGNAGPSVFDDFETDMMSRDYALSMRHVRAHAIETCEKMVLEDPDEKLLGAWTLSCPRESNSLRTLPFEECVLLLTRAAVYFCRMDWTTEKLSSFERVELADITELNKGAYITSALGKMHLDEARNVGFVIKFKAPGGGVLRKNTRSLLNEEDAEDKGVSGDAGIVAAAKKTVVGGNSGVSAEGRMLAFKALPPKETASKEDDDWDTVDLAEADIVTHICDEIRHAIVDTWPPGESGSLPRIMETDLISAAEAKRSTGYVESLGYSLKKMVWS